MLCELCSAYCSPTIVRGGETWWSDAVDRMIMTAMMLILMRLTTILVTMTMTMTTMMMMMTTTMTMMLCHLGVF